MGKRFRSEYGVGILKPPWGGNVGGGDWCERMRFSESRRNTIPHACEIIEAFVQVQMRANCVLIMKESKLLL